MNLLRHQAVPFWHGQICAALLWGCLSAWAQPSPQPTGNSLLLEATRTITSGCTFGVVQHGSLGISSDLLTLSSSFAGGSRPSLVINVIGSSTLSQSGNTTWTLDGQSLGGINTQTTLMTSASAGNSLTLPLLLGQSGSYQYHLDVSGTRAGGFMTAGTYKTSTTFNCI